MTAAPQVVSASMFLDRRLLHVCDPDGVEELLDVTVPPSGQMLSAAAHGCLVLALREAEVVVHAEVHAQRPEEGRERESVCFEVPGPVVLINNPLWPGPPAEIRLELAPGLWRVDVHQGSGGAPLTLRFWPGSEPA